MKNLINSIQAFMKLETAGGIVLIFAIALSMIVANSPLYDSFYALSHSEFSFNLLGLSIERDFHFFVNDGLLAVFFFLIALELKRELIEGELKDPKNIMLPLLAAVAGILFPVGIYMAFNNGTPTEGGWAIPAATDIAIAFGILLLAGKRVPPSLKIFLLSLAIIDDVGVIAIIAFFFTESLNYQYLFTSIFITGLLVLMNYKKVENFAPFGILGFFLWYCVYMSGIHATIAGVILGLTIPMSPRGRYDEEGNLVEKRPSMLESLEHSLHEVVSFLILPIFAFVNAGVKITESDIAGLTDPVSLGIILGLIVGKQAGIFLTSFALIKAKIVNMPENSTWLQIYAISALCGVGFTMGIFIGGLSFTDVAVQYKLPILIGSVTSAIIGLIAMRASFMIEDAKKPSQVAVEA